MPEGDTIHRSADRLRPALAGQVLVRFDAPRLVGDRPRPGTTIDAVEAVGKHLLVHFADGLTLQTHMRMTGSWHLYRAGERWQKAPQLARATIEVDGWVAVCFAAPVVRTYRRGAAAGRPGDATGPVAHLGPDLCAPYPDIDLALARMDALTRPGDEIGPVLLDQRVAAGIGNVYKSEVLFACGVNPHTPVDRLDPVTRRRLLATAAKLLRANLGPGRRTTAGPPGRGGLAVYRRQQRPCRRCGTPVRRALQRDQRRSTYWCPTCQPPLP